MEGRDSLLERSIYRQIRIELQVRMKVQITPIIKQGLKLLGKQKPGPHHQHPLNMPLTKQNLSWQEFTPASDKCAKVVGRL